MSIGLEKKKLKHEPSNEEKITKLVEFEERNITEDYEFTLMYTKKEEPVLLKRPVDLKEYGLFYRLYHYSDYGLEYCQLNLLNDTDNIEIADIVVLPERKYHKGYGTLLVNEAKVLAKKLGKNRLHGVMVNDSEEHHERQLKFYKKMGFTILDDKHHFEMNF